MSGEARELNSAIDWLDMDHEEEAPLEITRNEEAVNRLLDYLETLIGDLETEVEVSEESSKVVRLADIVH